jgi:hypothetical protein
MVKLTHLLFGSYTVLIDFTPVRNGEIRFDAFAQQFTREDLRAATNASIDLILDIIKDTDDAQIAYVPHDPLADDPNAPPEERHIGWSLAHLVAHVTATCEENAAYSSILARGIPYPRDTRLRFETHWRAITTKAQAVQRLEESRRIRLAYLDTWPDQPHLETLREVSDAYRERNGQQNAKAAFLAALRHESNHYDQFRDVAQQARDAARPFASASAAD